MTRKGSKNFNESEKKLLISIINDYEICDLPDRKMIEILSQKLGRSIKETTYYGLKNEAKKSRQTSEEWLYNFCRSGIIDFYKDRLEEALLVQKGLLRLYADESSKKDSTFKQDRVLLTKISKAISDNSKNLSELGMSPIILAKLHSLIPKEVIKGDMESVDKYFEIMTPEQETLWSEDSNEGENDTKKGNIMLDPSKAPTAILPPIDGVVNTIPSKETNSEEVTAQGDQPIF